jgi:integrase
VPLSRRAIEILTDLEGVKMGALAFPGQRGRPLSPKALRRVLARMGAAAITVHGFRSAFRDWCGNETGTPREIAEQALAHATGNATEAAYRRSDALEKRRALMETWASHCEPSPAGNVIPMWAAGG